MSKSYPRPKAGIVCPVRFCMLLYYSNKRDEGAIEIQKKGCWWYGSVKEKYYFCIVLKGRTREAFPNMKSLNKYTMRRIVTIILLLGCVMTMNAQTTAAAKNRVNEIKKMYAQAKESMKYRKDAELPPDEMVVSTDYMAAGAGPIKDVYHYYFSGDFDENVGADMYEVYFITRNHNVGATDYYEEYLFDDNKLVFYYEKSGDNETRYYFSGNKLVHSIIKGEESNWKEIDSNLLMLQRFASDTVTSFGLLMNRNY